MGDTPIYLRKKKDNGKIYYVIETKIVYNGKQTAVYLATIPSLKKILEWTTGEVSETHIKKQIEKRMANLSKVSTENKCPEDTKADDKNIDSEVRLRKINRTDTILTNQEPTEEEIEKSLKETSFEEDFYNS